MKKVYLVRHGESEYNAGGPIKPDNEIALTEHGHEQAEFIAHRAVKLGAEAIISSSLLRARQTAEHIANATGLTVETSDFLVERRYPSGSEGLTLNDPSVQEIEKLMVEKFGDSAYVHSDEEQFQSLKDRALKSLELLDERPEQTIVVVSHGVFLRVLVSVVLFGPEVTQEEMAKVIQRFKSKNTGLTLFEQESKGGLWQIRVWNDHAHLG